MKTDGSIQRAASDPRYPTFAVFNVLGLRGTVVI
jgi:hypothetical protein